jgi:hypothetical protein
MNPLIPVDEAAANLSNRRSTDARDLLLDVKLAEFSALKTEIGSRSDLQNRILQIYVTALTLVVGVIVTRNGLFDLVTLIPLVSAFAGMWYFDHALAIEGIGFYIATDIEHVINNSVLHRPRLLRWESGHMIEDIRWPESKTWDFSLAIIYSFLIPSIASICGIFILVGTRAAKAWNEHSHRSALMWFGVVLVELGLIAVSRHWNHQYWSLAQHWCRERLDRSRRVDETIVYRFLRASLDPNFGFDVEDLVARDYRFKNVATGNVTGIEGWKEEAQRLLTPQANEGQIPSSFEIHEFRPVINAMSANAGRDASPDIPAWVYGILWCFGVHKPPLFQSIDGVTGPVSGVANYLKKRNAVSASITTGVREPFGITGKVLPPQGQSFRLTLVRNPASIDLMESFVYEIRIVAGKVAAHSSQPRRWIPPERRHSA